MFSICYFSPENGEFDGMPNCGALKFPGDAKCGEPNAGPELPGRPNGGADGEPKGPLVFGPLYCGVDPEFGGIGKPALLTFCGGAGPGVDDPDGAGDAAGPKENSKKTNEKIVNINCFGIDFMKLSKIKFRFYLSLYNHNGMITLR